MPFVNCRWGFVIHGGIDGYSRQITFLKCSCNNRAQTVLQLLVFLDCLPGFVEIKELRTLLWLGTCLPTPSVVLIEEASLQARAAITNVSKGCGGTYLVVAHIYFTAFFITWRMKVY